MQRKLTERVISGVLTASMVFSMFTGLGTTAEATEVGAAASSASKTTTSARGQSTTAGKRNSSEGIDMPLVLDRTQLGFAEGVEGVEVTAYMTDIQYLGVLDLEEYAAFIPVSISLDKALWLDRELRPYIEQYSEAQRQAARGRALAKLQLEDQFIWDFVYDEEDFSDSLKITPVAFTVYDATEDTAPMIACRATVEWTGERPVNKVVSSAEDLMSLTGDGSSGETKSIYDESPEIQEFLRQLYNEGLTQDRSDYDLSQFESEGTSSDNFNLLGIPDTVENDTEMTEDTTAPGSSDTAEGTGAVVLSGENEAQEEPEESRINVYEQAEEALADSQPEVTTESAAVTVDAAGLAQAAAAAAAAKAQEGQVVVDEDPVPQAQAPEEESEESDGSLDLPQAYFHVKMKANESINTYGMALYFPSTETVPDTSSLTDSTNADLTEGREAAEEPTESGETADSADAAGTAAGTDPAVTGGEEGQTGAAGEGQSAGSQADGETSGGSDSTGFASNVIASTAGVTTFSGAAVGGFFSSVAVATLKTSFNGNSYTSTGAASTTAATHPGFVRIAVDDTVNIIDKLRALLGSNATFATATVGILDSRVGKVEVPSGGGQVKITGVGEGRTQIFAKYAGSYAVLELEVRGKYLDSNGEEKSAVPMVSSGQAHTLALMADGTVYGWGLNSSNQLTPMVTDSGSVDVNKPGKIQYQRSNGSLADLENIVMVAAGYAHSLALDADGYVWAWGANGAGQLGQGGNDLSEKKYPVRVTAPVDTTGSGATDPNAVDGYLAHVVAIAAGGNVSMAVTQDGCVYAWGDDSLGQLGQGAKSPWDTTDGADRARKSTIPLRVRTILTGTNEKDLGASDSNTGKIIQVSVAGTFAVALSTNGNLYSWGDNRAGQAGIGGKSGDSPVMTATKITVSSICFLQVSAAGLNNAPWGGSNDAPGHAAALGFLTSTTNFADVAATAYGWGNNAHGEVGNNSNNTPVESPAAVDFKNEYNGVATTSQGKLVQIQAGYQHTLVSTDKGTLYAWGYNQLGELGLGKSNAGTGNTYKTVPELVWSEETNTTTANADGLLDTKNGKGYKVYTMSAGSQFSIIVLEGGEVYGWGNNASYQVGDGAKSDSRYVMTRTGSGVSQSLKFNKVIVYTQEVDDQTGAVLSTTPSGRYADQLGVYTTPDTVQPDLDQLVETQLLDVLSITNKQYVEIYKDAIVRYYNVGFNVWERNRIIPYTTKPDYTYGSGRTDVITVKPIDGTGTVTGSILQGLMSLTSNNGGAELWPTTPDGVLDERSAITVAESWLVSGLDNEIYAGGFDIEVKDADNFTTPSVQCGEGFTLALKSDGTVWAWGDNTYGQLGMNVAGSEVPFTTYPVQVVGVKGVNKLSLVTQISAGFYHALALGSDGSVYAWGRNDRGQLGLEDNVNRIAPERVHRGNMSTDSANLTGITSIAAGGFHSLAVSKYDGYTYSWGDDQRGQLGKGMGYDGSVLADDRYRNYPDTVQVMSGNDAVKVEGISRVFAGGWHSLATNDDNLSNTIMSANGMLIAWGDNSRGQLGANIGINSYSDNISVVKYETGTPSGIVDVAAGYYHTVVMKKAADKLNSVIVFGDNTYGQLGRYRTGELGVYINVAADLYGDDEQTIDDVIAIGAGKFHTTIVRGTMVNGKVGTSKTYEFGLINSAATTWSNWAAVEIKALENKSLIKLDGGNSFTVGADEDGRVYAWGSNDWGQLGEFSLEHRNSGEYVMSGNSMAWIATVTGQMVTYDQLYGTTVNLRKINGTTAHVTTDAITLTVGDDMATAVAMTETAAGTGVYTANVLAGTYSVREKGVKIGTITVGNGLANEVTILYQDYELTLTKTTNTATIVDWADSAADGRTFGLRPAGETTVTSDMYPIADVAGTDSTADGKFHVTLPVGYWSLWDSFFGGVANATALEVSSTVSTGTVNYYEVQYVIDNAVTGATQVASIEINDLAISYGQNTNSGSMLLPQGSKVYITVNIDPTGSNEMSWNTSYTGTKNCTAFLGNLVGPVLITGTTVASTAVASFSAAQSQVIAAEESTAGNADLAQTAQDGQEAAMLVASKLGVSVSSASLNTVEISSIETGSEEVSTAAAQSETTQTADTGTTSVPTIVTASIASPVVFAAAGASTSGGVTNGTVGTYVEMRPGDVLNISGTNEVYFTDFRLRKRVEDTRKFTTADVAYVVTSSDPTVVAASGTNPIALRALKSGEVTIRIYNPSTTVASGWQTQKVNNLSAEFIIKVATMDSETGTKMVANPALSAGKTFTTALKSDGLVYTWGSNELGQLGAGLITEYSDTPVSVVTMTGSVSTPLSNVVAIASGVDHGLAVQNDGTVWAWGSNLHGQLGQGSLTPAYSDVAIKVKDIPDNVIKAAAGDGYSLLLTSDGTVYSFGYNDRGQLGVGYTGIVRRYAYGGATTLSTSIPRVYGWTNIDPWSATNSGNQDIPTEMEIYDYDVYLTLMDQYNEEQKAITEGTWPDGQIPMDKPVYNSDVLKPTQVLIGDDAGRQTNLSHIIKISAGDSHAMALRSDGAVFAWGDNTYGQLGVGDTANRRVAVQVLLGSEYSTDEKPHYRSSKMVNAMDIAAGGSHSVVMVSGGAVYSWGDGSYGQMGNNKSVYKTYAKDAQKPAPTTVTTTVDDATGKTTVTYNFVNNTPKKAVASVLASAVAAGGNTTMAIAASTGNNAGRIYSWGSNLNGQLGWDETSTITAWSDRPAFVQKGESANKDSSVTAFTEAIVITVGDAHSGAVKSDGYVWSWGYNGEGQLGDSTTMDRYGPVMSGDRASKVLVAAEYYTTKGGSLLKSYSMNDPMGSTNPARVDLHEGEEISFNINKIFYKSLTGFNLLSDGSQTDVKMSDVTIQSSDPAILTFTGVTSAGIATFKPTGKLGTATVVITSSELDAGTNTERTNFVAVPVRVQYQKVLNPGDDDIDGSVPMLAAGVDHSIALTANGEVYVWGCNQYGQLGLGQTLVGQQVPTPKRVLIPGVTDQGGYFTAVAAGDYFSLLLDNKGRVWSTGLAKYGQLGQNTRYQKISVWEQDKENADQMVEVVKDYLYYIPTWGQVVTEDLSVLGTTGSPVIAIAAGANHALALTRSGEVYAWGDNRMGQLGINRNVNEHTAKYSIDKTIDLSDDMYYEYEWELDTTTIDALLLLPDYYNTLVCVAKPVTKGASPSDSSYMDSVISIAAGGNNSFAVRHDGMLYGWGDNSKKQVGANSVDAKRIAPTQAAGDKEDNQSSHLDNVIAVAAGGTLTYTTLYGEQAPEQSQEKDADGNYIRGRLVSNWGPVTGHGLALRLDVTAAPGSNTISGTQGTTGTVSKGVGVLYGWGVNTSSQVQPATATPGAGLEEIPVRINPTGTSVRRVEGGYDGTLALTEVNGVRKLLAWGNNTDVRLGVVNDPIAVTVAAEAVDKDGTVNHNNESYMEDVDVFAVGESHSLVSRYTGFVYASGKNDCGQIGDYTNTDRHVPTLVGKRTYVTVDVYGLTGTYTGTVPSGSGSKFANNTTTMAPEKDHLVIDLEKLAVNSIFGLNLLDIKVSGQSYSDFEVISLDETMLAPNPLTDGVPTRKMFTSPGLTNASLLKYGETFIMVRYKPTGAVAMLKVILKPDGVTSFVEPIVSVGAKHTVALRSDGTVWAWGSNEHGQLGDGTFIDRAYPSQVCYPKTVTTGTGDSAVTTTTQTPITGATAVAAGDTFTLVAVDGKVWVLGDLHNVTIIDEAKEVVEYDPSACPLCGEKGVAVFDTIKHLIPEESNAPTLITSGNPSYNTTGTEPVISYLDYDPKVDGNGDEYHEVISYYQDMGYVSTSDTATTRWTRWIPDSARDPNTKAEYTQDTVGMKDKTYYVIYLEETLDDNKTVTDRKYYLDIVTWMETSQQVATTKYRCVNQNCSGGNNFYWDPEADIPYCPKCKDWNLKFDLIYDDAQSLYVGAKADAAKWVDGVNNRVLEYKIYRCANDSCHEIYYVYYAPESTPESVPNSGVTRTTDAEGNTVLQSVSYNPDGTVGGLIYYYKDTEYVPNHGYTSRWIPKTYRKTSGGQLRADHPLVKDQLFYAIYCTETTTTSADGKTTTYKYDRTIVNWQEEVKTARAALLTYTVDGVTKDVTGITDVAAGSDHGLAVGVDAEGETIVWAFGDNEYGQLGQKHCNTVIGAIPVKGLNGMGYLTNVTDIAAGTDFSMALLGDGSAWAWGSNEYGQLGTGTIMGYDSANGGKAYYVDTPIPVYRGYEGYVMSTDTEEILYRAVKIDADGYTGAAITFDQVAGGSWERHGYVWGRLVDNSGNYYNTNMPTLITNASGVPLAKVASLSVGHDHVAAVNDGVAMGGGKADWGQTGVGTGVTTASTVLYPMAAGESEQATAAKLDMAAKVYAGGDVSFVLSGDGRLLGVGDNRVGQLGIVANGEEATGATTQRDHEMTAHYVGYREADMVQILFPGETSSSSGGIRRGYNSIVLPAVSTVTMDLSASATASILRSYYGFDLFSRIIDVQRSVNTKLPSLVFTSSDSSIVAVSAGGTITTGTGTSGSMNTSGYPKTGHAVITVSDANTYKIYADIQVAVVAKTQDGSANRHTAPMVAAGESFTVALDAQGLVWWWGDAQPDGYMDANGDHQPSPTGKMTVPTAVKKKDGTQLSGIVAIAAGAHHFLAMDNAGTVFTWGDNSYGQLGVYKTSQRHVKYIVTGWDGNHDDLPICTEITEEFRMEAFDDVQDVTTAYTLGIFRAAAVAAGDYHSFVIDQSGRLWAFGRNDSGQLGVGDTIDRYVPTQVLRGAAASATLNTSTLASYESIYLTDIVKVDGGGITIGEKHYAHSIALRSDGTFRPDETITRAAVASIIAQTMLKGYDPSVTYYTDLNDLEDHWARNYIAFCAWKGIFGGYEDGSFRPDRGINHRDLATVIARLARMNGSGNATFSGDATSEELVTRAEAVKAFNDYLGRGVDYDGLAGVTGGTIWSDVSPNHWAYLEIVEAANDHTYHWNDASDPTPPERWETAGDI